METERFLTSEQVSQYLIGNGLYLTGLEFLVEGQELGGFDLSFLRNFFTDDGRFPPEEVQRFQGEDALSSILLAKEREQKLCLAEYELRVATEDLKHEKDHRESDQRSSPEISTPDRSPGICSFPEHESNEVEERKHLNSAVMAYLMQSGYKVTALTFQEEAFPDFQKVHPPGCTLASYYHAMHGSQDQSLNEDGGMEEVPKENGVDEMTTSETQVAHKGVEYSPKSVQTTNDDKIATPDAKSPKESTANRIQAEGDDDSENMTPWSLSQAATSPVCLPSKDLLAILMDYLPKIVPNVLIKKRSECIPVLSTLIRDHPDVECRQALIEMLFGLIKHPDDEQRKEIVYGIGQLAECIGSQRIMQEIIPQCCELANHKRVEKRLMIVEVLGVISRQVEDDIRASLLLSLLQQLSTDAHSSVRKAALQSLIECLKAGDIAAHKQRTIEDMIVGFVMDGEASVSETALSELAPLLIRNECGLQLDVSIAQRVLKDVMSVLESCPLAVKSENNSAGAAPDQLRLPKNAQQKNIMALLDLYRDLLPGFAKICHEQLPYHVIHNLRKSESEDPLTPAADKERNALNVADLSVFGSRALAFEKWLDDYEDKEEGKQVRCFVTQVVPLLVSIIGAVAPVNECSKLREHFASVMTATCKALEWCAVEGSIKPLFLAASGLQSICSISSFTASREIRTAAAQRRSESQDAACVFPVCLSTVISSEGKYRFCDFVSALLTPSAHNQTAWAIENKKEFVSAIVFSGRTSEAHDMLLTCLLNCTEAQESSVRCGAALIAEGLCIHASYQEVLEDITPAVVQLAEDSELSVRLHAISALQQICIVHPTSANLQMQIYSVAEKIMTSDISQAKLAALGAFSSAASSNSVHAAFLLKQIPSFLDELRDVQNNANPFHLQLTATAVFDCLLVLEGVEIQDATLRGQLVASMESLMDVASSHLEHAQRQILSAMVNDHTSKLGLPKRRLLSFSKGLRVGSHSSDNSCSSDASVNGN